MTAWGSASLTPAGFEGRLHHRVNGTTWKRLCPASHQHHGISGKTKQMAVKGWQLQARGVGASGGHRGFFRQRGHSVCCGSGRVASCTCETHTERRTEPVPPVSRVGLRGMACPPRTQDLSDGSGGARVWELCRALGERARCRRAPLGVRGEDARVRGAGTAVPWEAHKVPEPSATLSTRALKVTIREEQGHPSPAHLPHGPGQPSALQTAAAQPCPAGLPFPILAAVPVSRQPRPCTGSRRLLPCHPSPSTNPTLGPLPLATRRNSVSPAPWVRLPPAPGVQTTSCVCVLVHIHSCPTCGPTLCPISVSHVWVPVSVLCAPGGRSHGKGWGRHSGGPRVRENRTSPGRRRPSPGRPPRPGPSQPGRSPFDLRSARPLRGARV